ncbi:MULTISPECIES: (d)CMP kinase [Methanosarcina]|jgi:cytidylate kinase|uniref:Cytidylate kinase n=8 Tax=Methanosarcina mazei TaxID=2209 RepID=KCY_METMA|nr:MULTISPECIES: AAA family ATPase [Methanosarcina]Q8PV21.1 RecName: Full=Cytidylate kinase; Short=CK; AltName: Full=Cytidine monophosphate kinase; Short=CMP kinase [Methanosarcina mazei Go1]AGF97532.1 Cytidylate kinase [Methanosarcina mazei Tuc01]AKB41480.1 Cytidylate kinase [Methanosarcina mazei WWM610]AKB62393.1 Cytidylate kinase [Methanosarcina mazei SarPi]AKB65727.1 Cytidylate kinase [Methanosarcina mazei S-6]AKB69129.1 Cytidylate kinase [Methanosarcina mazei LYC]
MQITVSGLPGSGTSTLSKLLAECYDLELISSGEIFRRMARERGMSLAEFGALAERDPSIDLDIDKNQKAIIHSRENIILESRLAGHMAQGRSDVIKIWIKAPLLTRVKRIQRREKTISFDEELKKTVERERSETLRYKNYYGIDITDLSIYDIVIDSEKWNQYQTLDILRVAIDALVGPE